VESSGATLCSRLSQFLELLGCEYLVCNLITFGSRNDTFSSRVSNCIFQTAIDSHLGGKTGRLQALQDSWFRTIFNQRLRTPPIVHNTTRVRQPPIMHNTSRVCQPQIMHNTRRVCQPPIMHNRRRVCQSSIMPNTRRTICITECEHTLPHTPSVMYSGRRAHMAASVPYLNDMSEAGFDSSFD